MRQCWAKTETCNQLTQAVQNKYAFIIMLAQLHLAPYFTILRVWTKSRKFPAVWLWPNAVASRNIVRSGVYLEPSSREDLRNAAKRATLRTARIPEAGGHAHAERGTSRGRGLVSLFTLRSYELFAC